jgi:micrococcal nuclease
MVQPAYLYKALITNVVDGDTVDAEVDVGFKIKMLLRLRLNRINTWELTSSNAEDKQRALLGKSYVVNTVLNKLVVIQTFKADAFGRYLAEVYYDSNGSSTNLNDELLKNGLAKLYER